MQHAWVLPNPQPNLVSLRQEGLRERFPFTPVLSWMAEDDKCEVYAWGGKVELQVVQSYGKATLIHTCVYVTRSELDFVFRAAAFYRRTAKADGVNVLIIALGIDPPEIAMAANFGYELYSSAKGGHGRSFVAPGGSPVAAAAAAAALPSTPTASPDRAAVRRNAAVQHVASPQRPTPVYDPAASPSPLSRSRTLEGAAAGAGAGAANPLNESSATFSSVDSVMSPRASVSDSLLRVLNKVTEGLDGDGEPGAAGGSGDEEDEPPEPQRTWHSLLREAGFEEAMAQHYDGLWARVPVPTEKAAIPFARLKAIDGTKMGHIQKLMKWAGAPASAIS